MFILTFKHFADGSYCDWQSLIHSEVEEITNKIQALDGIRAKLEKDLLKLQEDELELDDERELYSSLRRCLIITFTVVEGVKERMKFEQAASRPTDHPVQNLHLPPSSRRRKGEVLPFSPRTLRSRPSRTCFFAFGTRRASSRNRFHGASFVQ